MQHHKISWFIPVVFVGFAALCATSAAPQKSEPNPPISAARVEIFRGQLDSAEKVLWTVLSSDPNQPEALTLLGIIRGRQKRYSEAEALLRRAVQLDPKSLVARRNFASALVEQNKPEAAVEQYKEVVKLAPRDHQAKVELARLYVAGGQFADAFATLENIPNHQLPSDAVPVKAASLLGLGKRDEAAALIPRANRSPVIAAELAEVFLDGNAPEFAIKALNEAFRASQNTPAHFYYLKGRALQATGDASGALNALREALTRDPKSVETLIAMAEVDASKNIHADSLALLKRAYALEPDSPVVLRALVLEAIKGGQPQTASAAARALADKNPDNLGDLYLAGAAMLEGQDFVTAASVFDKYISQRPEDGKGFLGLGIAQLAQQHYPEAKQAFERALQIDPKLADAEYQLGVLADRQGAAAEAVQHFERAIQLQPQHAKALASLGGQYLQAGDLEKALAVLQRSVAADPKNPKAEYDLALVLSKIGKTEEAKRHMERSRALQTAEDLGKNPASVTSKPD